MTNSESSLTDSQEKLLVILPFPTTILSIFGSITIICMAYKTRRYQSWSTYTRLLVAMSIFDIIFTITFTMGGFLLPQETSMRIWAFGNDTTCSIIGTLLQFSYSGVLYNGMLSYYFLFAAKYGMKKRTISKYVEPIMHIICIGYPLCTSIAGLIMGIYHETELGQSCWIANYPENCGEGPDETGEPCKSKLLAYIFGAVMVAFTLFSLICNNISILIFVRKQMLIVPPEWRRRGVGKIRNNSSTTSSSASGGGGAGGGGGNGVFHTSNRRFLEDLVVAKSTQYYPPEEKDNNEIEKEEGTDDGVDVESQPKKKKKLMKDLQQPVPSQPHSITITTTTMEPSSSSLLQMIPKNSKNGIIIERLGGSSGSTLYNNYNDETTMDNNNNNNNTASLRREQHERLQLVASQSYLYVVAFFVPVTSTVILRILEGLHYSAQDEDKLFPLLILQQVLLPIQGFLNLLVYSRPKYMKCRKDYPEQTKLFAFRRAIYGDSVKPDPKLLLLPVDDSPDRSSLAAVVVPKEVNNENQQQVLALSPGSTRRRRDNVVTAAMTAKSPYYDVGNSNEPLSRPSNNIMLTRSIQSGGEDDDDDDEQHNNDHSSSSSNLCNDATAGGDSSSHQNKLNNDNGSNSRNEELVPSCSSATSKQSNITTTLTRFLPPIRRFSVQQEKEDTAGLGAPPSRKNSVQKSQWKAIRLTGALISSLTASRGDFSEAAEEESADVEKNEEKRGKNESEEKFKTFEVPVACIDTAVVLLRNQCTTSKDQGASSSYPPSSGGDVMKCHQRIRTDRVICYSDLTEPLESVCENPYEDEADDCSLSSSSRRKNRFMADHVVESSATAITPPRRRSSLRRHGHNESCMPDTEGAILMTTTEDGAAPRSSSVVVDLEFDRMNLTNHSKHTDGSLSSSLDAPLRMPSRRTSMNTFAEPLLDDDDDNITKNTNRSHSDMSSNVDTPLSVPTRVASSFEYVETPLDDSTCDGDGKHTTTSVGTRSLDTPLTLPSRVASSFEDTETRFEPSNGSDDDNHCNAISSAMMRDVDIGAPRHRQVVGY